MHKNCVRQIENSQKLFQISARKISVIKKNKINKNNIQLNFA